MTVRSRSLRRQIRESQDRRREAEADITIQPYQYPHGDRGLHVVELDCNDQPIVVSGPGKTWPPGAQVMVGSHSGELDRAIIGPEPVGRRGGASFALEFPQPATVESFGVESASPFLVPVGTQIVTLTGRGFSEDPVDIFEAVVFVEVGSGGGWQLDPYVSIGAATWISATEVEVPVTVLVGAEPPTPDAPARLINVRPRRA